MRVAIKPPPNCCAPGAAATTISGTATRKLLGHYAVAVDGEQVVCLLSSRLRKLLIYPIADATSLHPRVQEGGEIRVADPVAVSDIVSFVPRATERG